MPFAAEETGSHAEDTRSSALRCGSSPNLGSRFPDFRFPYPPYDIQIKFMRHMYHALDTSVVGGARVAVMESPTGTGKSLSIICAALSWVREAKAQLARQQEAASSVHTLTTEAEPDWITMFDPQQLAQDNKDHRKQQRKDKLDKRVARRLTNGSSAPLIRPEDEFLLGSSAEVCGYSSTSSDSGGSSEEEDEGEEGRPQVLFSSRTHSQLAQFAREINKTSWHGSVCVATLGSRKNYCLNDTVRRLGSVSLMNEKCNDLRQQKSVKSQRSSIGTSAAKEPKKTCRCTYANPGSIAMFKQACASSDKIMDMEDLVGLGKQLHACPYYGSRAVAKDADVVALPYNMLFQPQTRKSLGVKLRGRVVVVDEAHNLNDAINSMCSVNVSSDQLETALSQLQQYQHRYASRLLADNLQRINQTLRVLRSLGGVLSRAIAMTVQGHVGVAAGAGTLRSNNGFGRIVGVNEFLFETGLDNLNLFELLAFISDSKLAQKLNGFVQFAADEMARKIPCASAKAPPQPPQQQPRLGAMHAAVDFLRALTHANADGRILVTMHDTGTQQNRSGDSEGIGKAAAGTRIGQLRFLMLNPATTISPLLRDIRSLVLAGGTMEPLETLHAEFFPGISLQEELRPWSFRCGHVINTRAQLRCIALTHGPSGRELDFRASARALPDSMDELGRVLRNVCASVRGGVVVFFPSYVYEAQCYARWLETGLWSRLQQLRPGLARPLQPPLAAAAATSLVSGVFREADLVNAAVGGGNKKDMKENSVEGLLNRYAEVVHAPGSKGALILCVVGGKLSEGINFSDDLGRAVLMVGLPYANPSDVELKERMRYAKSKQMEQRREQNQLGLAESQSQSVDMSQSQSMSQSMSQSQSISQSQCEWGSQESQSGCDTLSQQGGRSGGSDAGQAYYERLCMRAVNQCIGRAIRHRGDYAAVLLLDKRYSRQQTLKALPAWITGLDPAAGDSTTCDGVVNAVDAGQGATISGEVGQVLIARSFGVAQQSLCRFFMQQNLTKVAVSSLPKNVATATQGGDSSSEGED